MKVWKNCNTVRRETLVPGKKFGKWLQICQITICQIFPLVKVPRSVKYTGNVIVLFGAHALYT